MPRDTRRPQLPERYRTVANDDAALAADSTPPSGGQRGVESAAPGAGGLEVVPGEAPAPAPAPAETAPAAPFDEFEADVARGRAPDATKVVIGTDDRRRVTITEQYPWRCICQLNIVAGDGSSWLGTGWLISPRTVITAGHVVFMAQHGGWVRQIEVSPGRDGDRRPFGSVIATSLRSVQGWTQHGSATDDFGAILLPPDQRFGDQVGFFGLRNYDDAGLNGTSVNVAGYPGDKPGGTLWWHARELKSISPETLVYEADTAGGQSGGPVWRVVDGQRFGVGVHNYGDQAGNSATRVNGSVFQVLDLWRQEGA
jgi:V8-like Glu-specific endopeptidase